MINSLGLFAALGTPEQAALQAAPGDDPAVFAAALVAALGLQQPVQVTVTPAQPVVETAQAPEATEEQEPQAPDAEPAVVMAEAPAEPERATNVARVPQVVARVTPDPETVEEAETFGRLPLARQPAAGSIDVRNDEPAVPADVARPAKAVPVPVELTVVPTVDAPVSAVPVVTVPVNNVPAVSAPATSEPVVSAPVVEDVTPQPGAPVAKAPVESKPVVRKSEREKSTPAREVPETASASAIAVPQPVAVVPQPVAVVPMVPVTVPTDDVNVPQPTQAPTVEPEAISLLKAQTPPSRTAPVSPAEPVATNAKGEPVEPVKPESRQPPQSIQERTARAIAENVRVGRQLAELLGDENVTDFSIELGRRPVNPDKHVIPPPPTALDAEEPPAPVVWQRMPKPRNDSGVQGSFGKEALEPILARPFARDSVRITPVASRPDIVRMTANASLAMSPTLTEAEGNPAVGKAPAPSVTPSLPVVRQELPASREAAPSEPLPVSEERDEAKPRASHSSADASASSTAAANNSPAPRPAAAPDAPGESREARNLPSPASTEEKAAGSADRVSLQVSDDEGRQTRIRVSVTGSQVRAVITPPDSLSARQLEQRMDQLHDTLVRQGFTDPKVVVRSAPEIVSESAVVAAAGSSQDVRSAVPAGKDQPAGDQRQGRGQREQDRGDGHRHPQGHSRERDPRDRRR